MGIGIPTALFFVLYLLGFVALRRRELLNFFVFLVPISQGILLYYLNIVFAIIFLVRYIRHISIKRAVIISFILILWEALHLIPNSFLNYNESVIKLLGFALCLLITSIAISNYKLNNNYVSILFSWCIGLLSLCLILLVKYVYSFGINSFTVAVRRFGWIPASLDTSSTSLLINPNSLGKLVTLTVFCLLAVLKYERKYKAQILILVIGLVGFGLMTGSRSFLLVFAVLSILYMQEIMLNINQNKKMFKFLIITAILALILMTTYMDSTFKMIAQRIEEVDFSGSRFEIYRKYINVLKTSPYLVYGSGMQDYNLKYDFEMSSHNYFIEVISIWGIIGLIISFYWFVSLYKSLDLSKNFSIRNKTILHYLPLFGLFLYAQVGQFFVSYYHTLPTLILAFLNIKYVEKKLTDSSTKVQINVINHI